MTVQMIGGLGATLAVASLLLAWAQNRAGAPAGRSLPFGRFEAGGGIDPASASVFLALMSIAAFCILAIHPEAPTSIPMAIATRNAVDNAQKADADVARIRAYLESAGRSPAPKLQSTSPQHEDSGLPDVNTMIAQLEVRLETSPGDVDGWRTLGWSYRHTDRPGEAVVAYERAAALAPERTDIAEALAEARSASNASEKSAAAQQTK